MNPASTPDPSFVAVTARLDQRLSTLMDEALSGVERYDHLDDVDATVALFSDLQDDPSMGRFELAGGFAALAIRLHRSGYRGDPRDQLL